MKHRHTIQSQLLSILNIIKQSRHTILQITTTLFTVLAAGTFLLQSTTAALAGCGLSSIAALLFYYLKQESHNCSLTPTQRYFNSLADMAVFYIVLQAVGYVSGYFNISLLVGGFYFFWQLAYHHLCILKDKTFLQPKSIQWYRVGLPFFLACSAWHIKDVHIFATMLLVGMTATVVYALAHWMLSVFEEE